MKGHGESNKYHWDALGKHKLIEYLINVLRLNSDMRSTYSSKATVLFIIIPLLFSGENEASSEIDKILEKWFFGFGIKNNGTDPDSGFKKMFTRDINNDDDILSFVNAEANRNLFNRNLFNHNIGLSGGGILNSLCRNVNSDFDRMYRRFADAYNRFYGPVEDFPADVSGMNLDDEARSWFQKLIDSVIKGSSFRGQENVTKSDERDVKPSDNRKTYVSQGEVYKKINNYTRLYKKWKFMYYLSGGKKANERATTTTTTTNRNEDASNGKDKSMSDIFVSVYGLGGSNDTDSKINNTKYTLTNVYGGDFDNVKSPTDNEKKPDPPVSFEREEKKPRNSDTFAKKRLVDDGSVPNDLPPSPPSSPHPVKNKYFSYNNLRRDYNDYGPNNMFSVRFTDEAVAGTYRKSANRDDDEGVRKDGRERRLENGFNDMVEVKQVVKREARDTEDLSKAVLEDDNDKVDRMTSLVRKRSRLKDADEREPDEKEREAYLNQLLKIVKYQDDMPDYSTKNYATNHGGDNTRDAANKREKYTYAWTRNGNEHGSHKAALKQDDNSRKVRGDDSSFGKSASSQGVTPAKGGAADSDSGDVPLDSNDVKKEEVFRKGSDSGAKDNDGPSLGGTSSSLGSGDSDKNAELSSRWLKVVNNLEPYVLKFGTYFRKFTKFFGSLLVELAFSRTDTLLL